MRMSYNSMITLSAPRDPAEAAAIRARISPRNARWVRPENRAHLNAIQDASRLAAVVNGVTQAAGYKRAAAEFAAAADKAREGLARGGRVLTNCERESLAAAISDVLASTESLGARVAHRFRSSPDALQADLAVLQARSSLRTIAAILKPITNKRDNSFTNE
jgi:hypothetical protein